MSAASAWAFQLIHAIGLTTWLSVVCINNMHAFRSSLKAVAATMGMTPLKQEPPVETPLLARAVQGPGLHRLALLIITAVQTLSAAAGWIGSYRLATTGHLAAAQPWLNIAVCGFAAVIFVMHLGGLWFGYWIRQDKLHLTHIAQLIWGMAAFFLFNGYAICTDYRP
jgi:predicted small integral membrane protein